MCIRDSNKIDRINKEIAKTREKITEYKNKLKGLEAQKTKAENLEIVQLVRAMRMTPQELNAMLSGGGIPGIACSKSGGSGQQTGLYKYGRQHGCCRHGKKQMIDDRRHCLLYTSRVFECQYSLYGFPVWHFLFLLGLSAPR